MKNTSIHFTQFGGKGILPLITLIILSIATSCRRPDGVGPNDHWCTSGMNVLTVNDDNVPATIKNQIYSAPVGYVSVGSPNYNPNLPVVIIPFQFRTEFPFNSMLRTVDIRQQFFELRASSVNQYFSENSWGQFNLQEGFIANAVTLSQDPAYYSIGQPESNWNYNSNVGKEICQNSNVDWSALDANGDHIISRREAQVCFMLSAPSLGAYRPYSVSISTKSGSYVINGNFIFINCRPNDDPLRGFGDIRYNFPRIWMELCHGIFGMPYRYVGSCGVGKSGHYDVMCDFCPETETHMSVYDKMKIGWIRPRILVKPSQRSDGARHCFAFPMIEHTPTALILWDRNQPNEYWMVENRNGWDVPSVYFGHHADNGLAIWWVNETTDDLTLVDARRMGIRPQFITYPWAPGIPGIVFRNWTYGATDPTYDMRFLRSGSGFTEFAIRAVSPPGDTMYAEF